MAPALGVTLIRWAIRHPFQRVEERAAECHFPRAESSLGIREKPIDRRMRISWPSAAFQKANRRARKFEALKGSTN